jgi:hypothetical protein
MVRREPCDIAVVTGTGWKAMSAVALLPRDARKVFFEVMSGATRFIVHSPFLKNEYWGLRQLAYRINKAKTFAHWETQIARLAAVVAFDSELDGLDAAEVVFRERHRRRRQRLDRPEEHARVPQDRRGRG